MDKTANIISKKDLYYNYDKFKKGEKNLLLVSGYSGGGKSTVARRLARDTGALFVELDDFKKMKDSNPAAPIVKDYLEKNPHLKGKINQVSHLKYLDDYINHAKNYAKSHPDQKFILEGIQNLGKDVSDTPKMVVGTGLAKANFRARKRMIQTGMKRSGAYEILNAALLPKVQKERFIVDKLSKGYSPDVMPDLLNSRKNAHLGMAGAATVGAAGTAALIHSHNKKKSKDKDSNTVSNVKKTNYEKVAMYEDEIYKVAAELIPTHKLSQKALEKTTKTKSVTDDLLKKYESRQFKKNKWSGLGERC